MTRKFTFENLSEFIGEELGVSRWVTIDQDQVNAFADCTGDHQWIHVDLEKAAAGPLGGTIAHGFLTLSLLPMLSEEMGLVPEGVQYALNYGADRLRFINFVKVGSRVRNRAELMSVTPKNNGGILMKTKNTMEIDGEDKPAMVAETLTLIFPG